MRKSILPVTAWVVTLAGIIVLGGRLVEPPLWARWTAVAGFGLLLPAALWLPTLRASNVNSANRTYVFLTLSAICVMLASVGGGVGSLASLAIAFPVIVSLDWFSRDRTIAHTLALFGALLLLDVLAIGRAVGPESTTTSALALAAIMVLVARGRNQANPRAGPQSVASVDAATLPPAAAEKEPHQPGNPAVELDEAALERAARQNGVDSQPGGTPAATRQADAPEPIQYLEPDTLGKRLKVGSRQWWRTGGEYRVIAEYLLDVRASTGAEEAVVWLLNDGDSVLRPLAACSSNQWSERSNADEKWMALVRWSAEAAVVQCGVLDNSGGYITAPLAMDGRLFGVLCLRRQNAFEESAEQVKTRATHHASCVARLVSLIELHTSSVARTAALDSALDAVRDLQDHASVESPSSAICDAILHVCGCDASALIRWYPEVASGTVEAGAGAFESFEQGAVQSSSIVGNTCQRATPFRVGAAFDLLARINLFKQEERLAPIGALCVQPMKRDGEILGALVAAWNAPTDSASHTAPSIEVLASVAAHALHAAWRLETVQIAARTDPLTGLSNRRFLDEQLNRVLAESNRYGDPASLILLDLDYFKAINDTHGHAVGDLVLKHVAETLLDGIRGVDLCARYGGEELAVLLPRTGLQGAVELAERLRSMVEARPLSIDGSGSIKVTASFGVACYPSHAPTPSALLSSADHALYRAKEAGRNRVRTAR